MLFSIFKRLLCLRKCSDPESWPTLKSLGLVGRRLWQKCEFMTSRQPWESDPCGKLQQQPGMQCAYHPDPDLLLTPVSHLSRWDQQHPRWELWGLFLLSPSLSFFIPSWRPDPCIFSFSYRIYLSFALVLSAPGLLSPLQTIWAFSLLPRVAFFIHKKIIQICILYCVSIKANIIQVGFSIIFILILKDIQIKTFSWNLGSVPSVTNTKMGPGANYCHSLLTGLPVSHVQIYSPLNTQRDLL